MNRQYYNHAYSMVQRLMHFQECFQSQNPEGLDQYSWSLVLMPVLPLLWWLKSCID